MSPRQRRFLMGTIGVAAVLLAQHARAATNPLELGDETIWLGETDTAAVDAEAVSAPADGAASPQELQPTVATNPPASVAVEPDPTLLHRSGVTEETSEVGKVATERSTGSWWRTLVSLAAVVGLITLIAWGYKLTGGFSGSAAFFTGQRRTQLLEVVGRTALTPRHSVCLVRAGGRVVLVGLSGDRMSPLDVVTDAEAAKLLGLAAQERSDSARAAFERTLVEESAQYDDTMAEHEPTEPESPRANARDTIASTLARLRSRIGRGIEQKVG